MKKLIGILIVLFTITVYAAVPRYVDVDVLRSSDHTKTWTPPSVTDTLVGLTATQTLTGKTIDADDNTITDIDNDEIKAAAAIAVNKLAALTASRAVVTDGSGFLTQATTTATEIGYVNGVTSAIQTQIDATVHLSGTETVTGAKTFSAATTFTGTLIGDAETDSSTTGDDQTLPTPSKLIYRSTNGSLTSIAGITAPSSVRQIFIWTNNTGVTVTVKDSAGAASGANRILTGSNANIAVPHTASLLFYYDTGNSRWRIIGGAGGGGGAIVVSTTQTLATSAEISISQAQRERVKIQGDSGASTAVTIPNGTIDGQELFIQGMSDADTVELDMGNIRANGPQVFYLGTLKRYIWDDGSTEWIGEGL